MAEKHDTSTYPLFFAVVEVFKKESIEVSRPTQREPLLLNCYTLASHLHLFYLKVIVQSEDDISYRMAFKERFIQQTSETESSIESEETEKTKKSPRDLPPESFFPFSPKHPNKFFAEERPLELTNDYLKSFTEKPETEIPQKCVEVYLIYHFNRDLQECRRCNFNLVVIAASEPCKRQIEQRT